MKSDTRAVSWFLTVNNPTTQEEDFEATINNSPLKDIVRYAKGAKEEGEGRGTPHIHIYLHLTQQARFSAIKKIFPRADIGESIGSPGSQIDYIGNPDFIYSEKHPDKDKAGKRKGGSVSWIKEIGNQEGICRGKEKRYSNTLDKRLEAMRDAIDDGQGKGELYALDFAIMIRFGERLAAYSSYLDAKRASDLMAEKINGVHERIAAEKEELKEAFKEARAKAAGIAD